jgi:hypothetical protein
MCQRNKKAGRACYDQHPDIFEKAQQLGIKHMRSSTAKEQMKQLGEK